MQTLNCNIDQQMISKIEKNNRQVTDFELACLCKCLETTPNEILKSNDKNHPVVSEVITKLIDNEKVILNNINKLKEMNLDNKEEINDTSNNNTENKENNTETNTDNNTPTDTTTPVQPTPDTTTPTE